MDTNIEMDIGKPAIVIRPPERWEFYPKVGEKIVISRCHPALDSITSGPVTKISNQSFTIEWKAHWDQFEKFAAEHRPKDKRCPPGHFRLGLEIEAISTTRVDQALRTLTALRGMEDHNVTIVTPLQALLVCNDFMVDDIAHINNADSDRRRQRDGFTRTAVNRGHKDTRGNSYGASDANGASDAIGASDANGASDAKAASGSKSSRQGKARADVTCSSSDKNRGRSSTKPTGRKHGQTAGSAHACTYSRLRIVTSRLADEAGQATEPTSAVLLANAVEGGHVMVVGDEHQLAPTVKDQRAEWDGLSCSLLARPNRIHKGLKHIVMLEIQYRMHPDIQGFPNTQYYDGVLKCGLDYPPKVIDGVPWPRTQGKRSGTEDTGNLAGERGPRHRVMYIHCNGQELNNGSSPCNRMQADAVKYVLHAVHRQYTHPPSVCIGAHTIQGATHATHPTARRVQQGASSGQHHRCSTRTRGRPRDHQLRQGKRDWECGLHG